MAAVTGKKRRSATRGQDRERVARTKLAQIPAGLWKRIRHTFSAKARGFVDAIATDSVTLTDVLHLEAAALGEMLEQIHEAQEERREAVKARKDLERLKARVEMAKRAGKDIDGKTLTALEEAQARVNFEAPGLRSIQYMQSTALQSRKHFKSIVKDLGPVLDLGNQPVRVPEGYDLEGMAKKVEGTSDDEVMN